MDQNSMQQLFYQMEQTEEGIFCFPADPGEPYLADHDVGTPLLGTVMSLEAMAQAWYMKTGKNPGQILQVCSGTDCLVPEEKLLQCFVDPEEKVRLCDGKQKLFTCLFREEEPVCEQETMQNEALSRILQASPGSVWKTQQEIYQVFFHGPAFQVVSACFVTEGRLLSQMSRKLPPLSAGSGQTLLPVRMIEFALQSSGLYDLYGTGENNVPEGIQKITIFNTDKEQELFAAVEKKETGSDIAVFDRQGRLHLLVEGYTTKRMPE